MELEQIASVLLFFGGFMGIVLGINVAIRWTNRRFPSDNRVGATLEQVEHRLAEMEERLDSTDQLLADVRRQQLPR